MNTRILLPCGALLLAACTRPEAAPADAFVEFGERHDMFIVGHTLRWGRDRQPEATLAAVLAVPREGR